jgi:hypothetical protein
MKPFFPYNLNISKETNSTPSVSNRTYTYLDIFVDFCHQSACPSSAAEAPNNNISSPTQELATETSTAFPDTIDLPIASDNGSGQQPMVPNIDAPNQDVIVPNVP